MSYEYRRVLFPWSWEVTGRFNYPSAPDRTKEFFRLFLTMVVPHDLLGVTITSDRVEKELVNFKGREPGEMVSGTSSDLPAAQDHELLYLAGTLAEPGIESPSEFTISLTTPFFAFRGSDMVFRTKCHSSGDLPTWALLESLLSGVDFNISELRAGATRYRKRFGSSLLGVSPVIEEQILIDCGRDSTMLEYRCFNLINKELPPTAWIHSFVKH